MPSPVPAALDQRRLRARLVEDGPFAAVDVVTVTGSTNTDLAEAARYGAADRTVLLAEEQRAGRGRMQRQWVSPRGYALQVSMVLRPDLSPTVTGWLPLLAGLALAETVERTTPASAALKWPNDLLLHTGGSWLKAAGILAEGVVGDQGLTMVLGIGLNVHHRPEELPAATGGLPATSLAAVGAEVERTEFAIALLTAFAEIDTAWRGHGGDVLATGLLDRYRRLCRTLDREVRVEFEGAGDLHGTATGIDPQGRLLVRDRRGTTTAVSAGDVVHLR